MSIDANQDWISRERSVLARGVHRTSDPTFGPVIVRGAGSRVWDAAGRSYFDLTCGYSAANFGHAFAPLVHAAAEQLTTLTHVTGMPHPGRAALAEALIRYCGTGRDDRVLFNTSGSRAIETAIKAAVSFRPGQIVSIGNAYHGRSWLTSRLSDTCRVEQSDWQQRLDAWLVRRPTNEYAYCAACPLELSYPTCRIACQDSLIAWIEAEHATICAIIAEPALGARGYIAPPSDYWLRVREVTRQHGILMIADEIQMGLGRAGDWLLSRLQGWQADVNVLGKSLGGGITPISAVIGRAELLDAIPAGAESETFAASPLGTAVGCEVVRQLATGPWMTRASLIGSRLRDSLQRSSPSLKIEAFGASVAIEFFDRARPVAQCAAAARSMAENMVRSGLLVHYSGPLATRIVMLPPLTMSDDELAEVLELLEKA